ncbi:unnamed protein product [Didymodactylos carnosus]|uniref:G-protein coupled receptors family 1 profile domain-containing protein n=1 Tax=Didymodactylos carnosus TaxID=1234261 RepID=A0A815BNE7_9BILA|nr:unnamed protein product [Didymodactylos carnosus]CAF1272596.1 unnamed protein product [Didymodactylos carnosus]CAF4061060.1 unnamed protein product [Didymodactylos carnosus]CAF4077921.1 unnamed protein product [Didymodactylos carnosus]
MASPVFLFIDVLALLALLIGLISSSLIIFIVLFHRRQGLNTIPLFLVCNSCSGAIVMCAAYFSIYVYILKNDLSVNDGHNNYGNDPLCPLRTYLFFSGASLLYLSYCLQALNRLIHVVFPNKSWLQKSFIFYITLIVIQWILGFLIALPYYMWGKMVYITTELFCLIPFQDPLAIMLAAMTIYGIPLTILSIMSFWIWSYVHGHRHNTIQRQTTVNREFVMLKRMLIPLFALTVLGVPYLTLFTITWINHKQLPLTYLTYRLSYLFIAIGLGTVNMITLLLTPKLKAIFLSYLKQKRSDQNSTRQQTNLTNAIRLNRIQPVP